MLSCLVDNKYIVASKALDRKLNFKCPVCFNKVVLKAGKRVIPHFAHHVLNVTCKHGIGETAWHRKGKICVADIAKKNGFLVKFEHKLGNRRVDVFVQTKTKKLAFELQQKDESINLYKRTNDLLKHVDQVYWILPWKGKRINEGNRYFNDTDPPEYIVKNYSYRATATYAINALYSTKKKPKNTHVRFYDEKENVLLKCTKSKWETYIEGNDFGGGYNKTSKRWCKLRIIERIKA